MIRIGEIKMDLSKPLVELQGLTKIYGGSKLAVNQMNLIIPRGRIIGLLGPNGSGKTTMIKMINGLLAPTRGSVLINGMPPGPESKAVISYLPERTYLPAGMKVKDIISFFAQFYQDFSIERAYNMLQMLGIPPAAQLKTLSKGTKEKIQLILVMSRQAELYILDEPIAGVDPAARDYILHTIMTNYNPQSSILLSTHLISDIEQILDEVIFIRYGQAIMHAPAEAVRRAHGKSVDAYFREVFAC